MAKLIADHLFNPSAELIEMQALGTIQTRFRLDPGIKNIRMSIKEVYVAKRRELIGKSEIYIISLVTDNLSAELVKIETQQFNGIKNKTKLNLGPSGIAIYRNEEGKIPRFLDFRILVMESDQEAREVGEAIEDIRKTEEYKEFKKAILAATGLGQPQIALIGAASDFVLSALSKILRLNKDDQLIYVQGSYDAAFDDLGTGYGSVEKSTRYASIKFQVEAI